MTFVAVTIHLIRNVFKEEEAVRFTVEDTDFPNSDFCLKPQLLIPVFLEVTDSFSSHLRDCLQSAQV